MYELNTLVFEPLIWMINLSINLYYSITHTHICLQFQFLCTVWLVIILQCLFVVILFSSPLIFRKHFSHTDSAMNLILWGIVLLGIYVQQSGWKCFVITYKYSVISTWILSKNIHSWLTFFSNTFCTNFQMIFFYVNYLFLQIIIS